MLLLLSALLLAPEGSAPPLAVPIGYCSSLKEIDAVRAAGFDYVRAVDDPAIQLTVDYTVLCASLREIGYAGRMSVEARSADFAAEAPRSIAFLRGAFAR